MNKTFGLIEIAERTGYFMELPPTEQLDAHPYVLFQIKESCYAVSCEYVSDIQPIPGSVSQPPRASQYISGIFNSFGRAVTVLDLPMLLGLYDAPENIANKSVIILQGKPFKGLLVDRILSILSPDNIRPVECGYLADEWIENVYESVGFDGIFMKINVKKLLLDIEADKLE